MPGYNSFAPKVNIVAGAAADTNIAISGIKTDDVLISVVQFEPDNGSSGTMMTDRTSVCSISSDGNIQCTQSTAGKQLFVFWHDSND